MARGRGLSVSRAGRGINGLVNAVKRGINISNKMSRATRSGGTARDYNRLERSSARSGFDSAIRDFLG